MFKRKPKYRLLQLSGKYLLYVNNKPSKFTFESIDDAKAFTSEHETSKWKCWENRKKVDLIVREVNYKSKKINIIQDPKNKFRTVQVKKIGLAKYTDTIESHDSFTEASNFVDINYPGSLKHLIKI